MSVGRPHVLLLSLDAGIRWSSPKGASIHLRMMAGAMETAGAVVSILTPDGLSVDGGAKSPRFEPVSGAAAVRAYHRDEGRVGSELGALAMRAHAFDAIRSLHACRAVDLVYERYSLFSDVGAHSARELMIPLALEVNAPLIEEQARYRELVMGRAAELIERRQLETATRVFTVSRVLWSWAISRGANEARTFVLPNTADRDAMFRGAYRAPSPDEPFVIGFAGSLKPWHGIGDLLETFAAVHAERPRARLEVLGEGPVRAELETRAAALGLGEAVRFLGHVSFDEVPVVLARWHLVVAPYPPIEGFYFSPLKVVEALAAGRPVMASAVGDVPELLDEGRRGVLVAPGDARAWREALIAAVDAPDHLVTLASEAERTTRNWSWTRHAEHVLRETLRSEPAEARAGSEAACHSR